MMDGNNEVKQSIMKKYLSAISYIARKFYFDIWMNRRKFSNQDLTLKPSICFF
jgi:hypothetical protein